MTTIIFSDMNNALALIKKLNLEVQEPQAASSNLKGQPLLGRRGEPYVILQNFFRDLVEGGFNLQSVKAVRRYRYVHGELTNEYIGVSVQFILTNDSKSPQNSNSLQAIVDFYGDKPVPCVNAWKNTNNGVLENLTVIIVPTQSDSETPLVLRYKDEDIYSTLDRT